MYRSVTGLVAAVVLALSAPGNAQAQLSLSIGNPYGGGVYIGTPYTSYSSGYYGGYGLGAAPLTSYYSSGYSGFGYAPNYVAPVAPYYGVQSYNYSYGYPAFGRGYGYPVYGRGYGYGRRDRDWDDYGRGRRWRR